MIWKIAGLVLASAGFGAAVTLVLTKTVIVPKLFGLLVGALAHTF